MRESWSRISRSLNVDSMGENCLKVAKSRSLALCLVMSAFVLPLCGGPLPADDMEFFERRIRPVLVERCHGCHSAESKKLKGGLRLDSRVGILQGGESLRAAVIPGEPDGSLLIEAIQYQNPDLQMPPKAKLSDDQIADLTFWVKMGALWPEESKAKLAPDTDGFDLDHRRRTHWSWNPIVPQPLPSVHDSNWPLNPVDHFVLHSLDGRSLAPAGTAEKRSLIRRVYFDLIGLPPSPEAVNAFLSDTSSNAYVSVVDHLLGMPQFGERWARHWLDLVRYAETLGHEFDYSIPNAWRYRDYVIRALNSDVPYNRFVMEHIAGDLLPDPRHHPTEGFDESIIGTGFYWFGQQTHSPVDVRRNQADVIENQIDVLTKTFLGLTVACARCHDHKFDAISTRDYYSLYGIMESSRYAQRTIDSPVETEDAREQLGLMKEKIQNLVGASWLRQTSRVADYLLAAREVIENRATPADFSPPGGQFAGARSLDPLYLKRWITVLKDDASTRSDQPLHVWKDLMKSSGSAPDLNFRDRWNALVANARPSAKPRFSQSNETDVVFADFRKDSFKNWFVEGSAFGPKPNLPGELTFSDRDSSAVQLLPFGAAHSGSISSRLQGVLRSQTFTITNRYLQIHVSGRSSRINVFVDNFALIQAPIYGALRQTLDDGKWKWLSIDLEMWKGHQAFIEFSDIPTPDLAGGGSRKGYAPDGYVAVSRIVFSDQGKPPGDDESFLSLLASCVDSVDSIEELANAYLKMISDAVDAWVNHRFTGGSGRDSVQIHLLNWLSEHGLLEADFENSGSPDEGALASLIRSYRGTEMSLPNPVRTPAMADGTGSNEKVFIRGNPGTLGDIVPRRFLEAIDGSEPRGFNDGSGRIDLARRITDPSNPFLARVMVNRVWHHLFGRGIVATPDDFGVLGQRPTHPELLDWLAAFFQDEAQWSVKRLIRLLVTSRTYQMSSKPSNAQGERSDPENIWLHRMPIRRLEGEIIRDAILSVAGTLDDSMMGPSVPVYLNEFMDGRGRPEKSGPLNGDGRRSIYLEVRRNFLSPMMRTFDAPVPFSTAGRRTVSNVPAQSLILMNDSFVTDQAKAWAQSAAADRDIPRAERVERLYLTAFARPPTSDELDGALEFLDRQTGLLDTSRASGDDSGAWADLCHVLFNVKEFVFVN